MLCSLLCSHGSHSSLFDTLLTIWHMENLLHINARCVDQIRVNLTGGSQMLDFGYGQPGSSRHHRIEVARCLAINEVSFCITLECMNEGRSEERRVGKEVKESFT